MSLGCARFIFRVQFHLLPIFMWTEPFSVIASYPVYVRCSGTGQIWVRLMPLQQILLQ
jgi:hypothetical protein